MIDRAGFKRIRDPIHGLITFDTFNEECDRVAWALIDTKEFQRLRRVKQLGVSEFTFPGATHNRFAHSIGVYHNAKRLMKVAEEEIRSKAPDVWDDNKSRTALIAALLHDLGHGPFSHAFEEAEKTRFRENPAAYKDHEDWTGDIIRDPDTDVHKVLVKFWGASAPNDVCELLKDTTSIFSAVVSSSFDADRLDYLERDRFMTGAGAASIDSDWLIDNLRVARVPLYDDEGDDEVDGGEREAVWTFCFEEKALQAVETFILSRFHMYTQVYFHKTTRGIEEVLSAFLRRLMNLIKNSKLKESGISAKHPLVVFYKSKSATVAQYLALDDTTIWNAIELSMDARDVQLSSLARRLWNRRRAKAVEISVEHPTAVDKARRNVIEAECLGQLGVTVFANRAPLSVYSIADREREKPHKRVRIIRSSDGVPIDVARLSKSISALTESQELLRYYFLDESKCADLLKHAENGYG